MQSRWVFAASLTVGLLASLVQASGQGEAPLSLADGQRLLDKMAEISDGTRSGESQRVVIYQREVNAYLRFQGASQVPTGVTEPDVSLRHGGGVSVRATVDLSALRDARPRGALDPLRYLTGRLPVAADGVVSGRDGVGHVEVESVAIGGVPVPVSILTELVRYYSRSQEHPDGIEVTDPFDLPYGMTELRVERERVVVVP